MFIKHKKDEIVNTQYVQSIELCKHPIRENSDDDKWYIEFLIGKNYVYYSFETEKEREEYHEDLCKLLDAQEVTMLKL